MTRLCDTLSTWHVLILIGAALGTVLEGIVPHSFGTLIAHFKSINNTENPSFYSASQFQLNWLPALSSAIPSILLPLFTIIVLRCFKFYQFISIFGFTLLAISCGLSSLVTSWPILFITYSFIYSIGASLFLAVVIIIAAEYFPKEHRFHVLATSLYQIGYPVAALIGNPVLAKLISNHGWQNSLKLVAVIQIIIGTALSCLMKPLNNKGIFNNNKCDSVNEKPNKVSSKISSTTVLSNINSNIEIIPWLLGKYINYMCWYGLRTNIVTYLVKSTIFGLTNSATLMSVYAASEIIVAIIASLCGDLFRGWLIHIHLISSISLAVLTGIYSVVLTTYINAVLLMIGIGTSIQLSLSFGYPASAEVWNSNFDMKIGWILTNVAAGLGIISSPLISGILMDKVGLNSLFYAQCVGWILQAILFTITLILMKSKEIQLPYQEIDHKN